MKKQQKFKYSRIGNLQYESVYDYHIYLPRCFIAAILYSQHSCRFVTQSYISYTYIHTFSIDSNLQVVFDFALGAYIFYKPYSGRTLVTSCRFK